MANHDDPVPVDAVVITRSNRAIAIRVGRRFFWRVGKSGRLMTAWSLAGAKLFNEWDNKGIEKAEKVIASKGKESRRVSVVAKS